MDHDGDYSAFASARWSSLVRSAVFLGCSLDEAHDLAQTTLLRCYIGWRKVQRADDRDAYVYTILLNCHRDSRRRRWWGEQPTAEPPDLPTDADPADVVAVTDAVHRALADLSKVNREVVVLRFYAHLSEQQTAEVLGIAPGTVKSRVSRALAQLASNAHLTEGPA
jgi:RNA polymerase sigma-70 factor (sigma-E family)